MKLHFESVEGFLNMGGHGFYVWLAYALVAVALIGYYFYSKHELRKKSAKLERFYRQVDATQSQQRKKNSVVKIK